MKEIIRKFTCGHSEQMFKPVFWITVENLFMVFPAIIIYFVINYIVLGFEKKVDIQNLWLLTIFLSALTIGQAIISIVTFWKTFEPATIHSAENKTQFIHKIRALPVGYFLKKKTGEIINTFTGDFNAVEQSMVGLFTGIFSVIFSCILTSILLLIFNPIMALAFYIGMPLAIIMILGSMKLTGRLTVRNIEVRDKASTYLDEYLHGMRILKSYNQTGAGFLKLKNAYADLVTVSLHGEAIGGMLVNGATTIVNIGLPLMCFTGAYLLLGGRQSLAEYLSLIIIGTKIMTPVVTWIRYMVILRTHYVSASRIDAVFGQKEMGGDKALNEISDIIFDKVYFGYEDDQNTEVLKDMSFTIQKGKLTAIVGPSGGGKTTILRLIARFWDVDQGKISCNGLELTKLNPEEWLKHISMVLQDVYLFHETIRENILFGNEKASEEELVEACKLAQCHDFIMALPQGYDTVVGEGGSNLSGGEKQRIAIARALLKQAPILLLDEPTSSLDAKNEMLVQHAISELVKNKTVVMIAHRLKTVQNAHQILVVDKGEIVESGAHSQLIEHSKLYKKLWCMQQDSLMWNLK